MPILNRQWASLKSPLRILNWAVLSLNKYAKLITCAHFWMAVVWLVNCVAKKNIPRLTLLQTINFIISSLFFKWEAFWDSLLKEQEKICSLVVYVIHTIIKYMLNMQIAKQNKYQKNIPICDSLILYVLICSHSSWPISFTSSMHWPVM